MFHKSRTISLFVALAFVFVLAGAAAQQATTVQKTTKESPQETVTCPVSGETINKAEAKISWEYKGITYYFCCEGCKAKFMKDPESFLQKKVEGKSSCSEAYACPMCKDVKSDKPGKCPKCGMDMVKMEPGKDIIIKKVRMEGKMHEKGMMMQHGRKMGHEKMMGCPMMMKGGQGMMGGCSMMMMKDVELKVENTKDGITVTLTSKNPETVKMIQEHLAKMKEGCQNSCAGEKKDEPKKEVIIKEVTKK
jgi:YHS domain-containing protein